MTSLTERWARIEELFDAAALLPEHAQAAFLEQACGEDGVLREEVRCLLEAARRCGGFLEADPMSAFATALRIQGKGRNS